MGLWQGGACGTGRFHWDKGPVRGPVSRDVGPVLPDSRSPVPLPLDAIGRHTPLAGTFRAATSLCRHTPVPPDLHPVPPDAAPPVPLTVALLCFWTSDPLTAAPWTLCRWTPVCLNAGATGQGCAHHSSSRGTTPTPLDDILSFFIGLMFNHIINPVLWFLFGFTILGATQTLSKDDPFAETVGLAVVSSSQNTS